MVLTSADPFHSQEVRDKYTAVVKMIDSGDKLKLDQNHLETVIPAPGINHSSINHRKTVLEMLIVLVVNLFSNLLQVNEF